MVSVGMSEDGFVKGKNVMVTGCTSGIGMAATLLLADAVPKCIYIACRSQSKGESLQAELTGKGVTS